MGEIAVEQKQDLEMYVLAEVPSWKFLLSKKKRGELFWREEDREAIKLRTPEAKAKILLAGVRRLFYKAIDFCPV
ncbi:hypothetical protein JW851_00780 [Candidatus Woesearchaeota archaeon]|nr:hypothetical protein [Candidatus Woesearchaeota archaeon]